MLASLCSTVSFDFILDFKKNCFIKLLHLLFDEKNVCDTELQLLQSIRDGICTSTLRERKSVICHN